MWIRACEAPVESKEPGRGQEGKDTVRRRTLRGIPWREDIATLAAGRQWGVRLASGGPAGSQPFEKVDKQGFIVTVMDRRSVTVTNLGSRGFIPWPPEAQFLSSL